MTNIRFAIIGSVVAAALFLTLAVRVTQMAGTMEPTYCLQREWLDMRPPC